MYTTNNTNKTKFNPPPIYTKCNVLIAISYFFSTFKKALVEMHKIDFKTN